MEKLKKILKANLIPLIVVILLAILLVSAFITQKKLQKSGKNEATSAQQIAEKAINYINQNNLGGGATASLVEVVEEKEVYRIHLKIGDKEYDSYATKDGKFLFPQGIDLEAASETPPEGQKNETTTVGDFLITQDEVCKENEKPIIYFFGSEGCPHCKWEHPVIKTVAEKFTGYISFHNNMDSQNEMDVFQKYSDGGIPTLVFGCKYYRVGSGESKGQEIEIKNLTALICKLTGNQPADTCGQVQDLIDQIK